MTAVETSNDEQPVGVCHYHMLSDSQLILRGAQNSHIVLKMEDY